MTTRRLVTALLLVAVAACSGGSSGEEPTTTDAEDEATDEPVAIPGCDNTVADTFPRRSPRAAGVVALLEAVEVAEDGCLDVVRFDFAEPGVGAGLPPGYVVEYRPRPFVSGEAEAMEELDIAGSAFLVVTLESASRTFAPPDAEPETTYNGPTDITPGLTHIQEVVLLVDGPDRMEWVIGLDAEQPFAVDAASDPPRVTVKVA
jgi:hypothetical protein